MPGLEDILIGGAIALYIFATVMPGVENTIYGASFNNTQTQTNARQFVQIISIVTIIGILLYLKVIKKR